MAESFPQLFKGDASESRESKPSALDYGEWNGVVREVARFDFDEAERIAGWPVVEVLHAYLDILREHALAQYQTDMVIWAIQLGYSKNPIKRPMKPRILSDG